MRRSALAYAVGAGAVFLSCDATERIVEVQSGQRLTISQSLPLELHVGDTAAPTFFRIRKGGALEGVSPDLRIAPDSIAQVLPGGRIVARAPGVGTVLAVNGVDSLSFALRIFGPSEIRVDLTDTISLSALLGSGIHVKIGARPTEAAVGYSLAVTARLVPLPGGTGVEFDTPAPGGLTGSILIAAPTRTSASSNSSVGAVFQSEVSTAVDRIFFVSDSSTPARVDSVDTFASLRAPIGSRVLLRPYETSFECGSESIARVVGPEGTLPLQVLLLGTRTGGAGSCGDTPDSLIQKIGNAALDTQLARAVAIRGISLPVAQNSQQLESTLRKVLAPYGTSTPSVVVAYGSAAVALLPLLDSTHFSQMHLVIFNPPLSGYEFAGIRFSELPLATLESCELSAGFPAPGPQALAIPSHDGDPMLAPGSAWLARALTAMRANRHRVTAVFSSGAEPPAHGTPARLRSCLLTALAAGRLRADDVTLVPEDTTIIDTIVGLATTQALGVDGFEEWLRSGFRTVLQRLAGPPLTIDVVSGADQEGLSGIAMDNPVVLRIRRPDGGVARNTEAWLLNGESRPRTLRTDSLGVISFAWRPPSRSGALASAYVDSMHLRLVGPALGSTIAVRQNLQIGRAHRLAQIQCIGDSYFIDFYDWSYQRYPADSIVRHCFYTYHAGGSQVSGAEWVLEAADGSPQIIIPRLTSSLSSVTGMEPHMMMWRTPATPGTHAVRFRVEGQDAPVLYSAAVVGTAEHIEWSRFCQPFLDGGCARISVSSSSHSDSSQLVTVRWRHQGAVSDTGLADSASLSALVLRPLTLARLSPRHSEDLALARATAQLTIREATRLPGSAIDASVVLTRRFPLEIEVAPNFLTVDCGGRVPAGALAYETCAPGAEIELTFELYSRARADDFSVGWTMTYGSVGPVHCNPGRIQFVLPCHFALRGSLGTLTPAPSDISWGSWVDLGPSLAALRATAEGSLATVAERLLLYTPSRPPIRTGEPR